MSAAAHSAEVESADNIKGYTIITFVHLNILPMAKNKQINEVCLRY